MEVPNHGPLIIGVTWGLTIFSGGFLGLRIYAKLSRKQGLWWDDYILTAAWVSKPSVSALASSSLAHWKEQCLLFAQAVVTQAGMILGFGKRLEDIPPDNIPIILLGLAVMSTVSSFAATLSKMSFGVTLLRLTSGYMRCMVWFCTVTLFIVMLPSAVGPWVQCRGENKSHSACWDAVSSINYGIFNAAWCAAADFALALMPWCLIWSLQLKLREKIGVSIAMSMGIL